MNNCNYTRNNIINHTEFIMDEGVKYEKIIFEFLKNKYKNNIIQIAESNESRSIEKFEKTVESMKKGIDIIYQGVIHDYDSNLYGCPDLLIRSDKLNSIFKNNIINDNTTSIKLNTPFHYVVVDIKHSTLFLSSSGTNLLNCNSIPAYKGQILIYNKILKSIQDYEPPCGYIYGKKWTYTKNNITYSGNNDINSNNNIMGVINYNEYDIEYRDKVTKAIQWIHNMRNYGDTWKIYPKPNPNRFELYPNMKNDKDYPYHKLKVELNNKIHDITSVWNCGFNKRIFARGKKIYNWKDKRCNSTNMGFSNCKTGRTIDKILNINRQKKINIRYNELFNLSNDFHKKHDTLDFYIDYETVNGNIGQIIEDNMTDFIFMIGIGWEEDNKWMFKNFILKEGNDTSELDMMTEFFNFINIKKLEYGMNETRFIHWTQAEPNFYKKFLNKHTVVFPNINFYDLNRVFLDNEITIRGALDYKLKSIAKAMHLNKMIASNWDIDNPCSNGLDAMYMAYNIYKQPTIDIHMNETIINISKYNEIDCKVMWEILKYIRNI